MESDGIVLVLDREQLFIVIAIQEQLLCIAP